MSQINYQKQSKNKEASKLNRFKKMIIQAHNSTNKKKKLN